MNNQTTARQSHGGLAAAASAPRVQTQVDSLLSQLNNNLDQLDKAIQAHREKISPVLRSEPVVENNKGESPEEVLVPVADAIRSHAKRVFRLTHQVESMTERAEA